MTFVIRYRAGTYSGTKEVSAEDSEEALAKIQAWVRRQMTIPMYSESYRILEAWEDDDE